MTKLQKYIEQTCDTRLIFSACFWMYRVFLLYIVFFPIFENILDSGLSLFSFGVSVCTYTHQAGKTPVLQLNWQSSEKFQHFKEKTQ